MERMQRYLRNSQITWKVNSDKAHDENYSHINRSVLKDKYNQDYLIKVANYHEKLVDEFLGKKKKDID